MTGLFGKFFRGAEPDPGFDDYMDEFERRDAIRRDLDRRLFDDWDDRLRDDRDYDDYRYDWER